MDNPFHPGRKLLRMKKGEYQAFLNFKNSLAEDEEMVDVSIEECEEILDWRARSSQQQHHQENNFSGVRNTNITNNQNANFFQKGKSILKNKDMTKGTTVVLTGQGGQRPPSTLWVCVATRRR